MARNAPKSRVLAGSGWKNPLCRNTFCKIACVARLEHPPAAWLHPPATDGTIAASPVAYSSVSLASASFPLGACHARGTTTFAVWAPEHRLVELSIGAEPSPRDLRPLNRTERGYWLGAFDDLRP